MEFFKPLKDNRLRWLEPLPYLSTHKVPENSKPWQLSCTRDAYCPICERLTEATRIAEFYEAQLDWTW